MLRKLINKFVLAALVTTLVSCEKGTTIPNNKNSSETPPTETETLVLGDVSPNPTKKIERFQPLANYLAGNLSELGVGKGEVRVAPDLETMANLLASGEVDVYFDSPYPAMIVVNKSQAKPILRRWKKGHGQYSTVIFTMKENAINTLGDLQGKMVAFESNFSTTGYMLPLAHLLQNNLVTVEKSNAEIPVSSSEVGYVFSKEDENVVQWVISGKVDAGATDIHTYEDIPESTRAQMKIIAQTEIVPRNLVIVSEKLPPEVVDKLKLLLEEMHQTPEGKDILTKFEKTVKFDQFPSQLTIDEMQKLYEQVQNQQ